MTGDLGTGCRRAIAPHHLRRHHTARIYSRHDRIRPCLRRSHARRCCARTAGHVPHRCGRMKDLHRSNMLAPASLGPSMHGPVRSAVMRGGSTGHRGVTVMMHANAPDS